VRSASGYGKRRDVREQLLAHRGLAIRAELDGRQRVTFEHRRGDREQPGRRRGRVLGREATLEERVELLDLLASRDRVHRPHFLKVDIDVNERWARRVRRSDRGVRWALIAAAS
jgi:hypothetical protein